MRLLKAPGGATKFKYRGFMDCIAEIRREYLIDGKECSELWRKYAPLCENGFKLQTLHTHAYKFHWTDERDRLSIERTGKPHGTEPRSKKEFRAANSKPEGGVEAVSRRIEEQAGQDLARSLVDEVINLEREGARKHFRRMEVMIDKTSEVLEKKSDSLTPKNLGPHLVQLNQFDNLARRLYRMDKKEEVSSHQFNIAVLTQIERVPQEPMMIEAEASVD